jgi:hypothetical protein
MHYLIILVLAILIMEHMESLKNEMDKIAEERKQKRDSGLGRNAWQLMEDVDSEFNVWLSEANPEELQEGLEDYKEKLKQSYINQEAYTKGTLSNEFNEGGAEMADLQKKLDRRIDAIENKIKGAA